MSYQVAIRHNPSGEIRIASQTDTESYKYEWDDGQMFWWTDGNFGCDCNRELEFIRASGRAVTEEEFDNSECGTTVYTVLHAILPDGTIIPIEEGKPE